jgi:hypothetical protein
MSGMILEEVHQACVVQAMILAQTELHWPILYAGDMNAGQRGPQAAMKAKMTGMMAGEPDFRVYLPAGRILFFEYKAKSGSASRAQIDRHAAMKALGHTVHIIKAGTSDLVVEATMHETEFALRRPSLATLHIPESLFESINRCGSWTRELTERAVARVKVTKPK